MKYLQYECPECGAPYEFSIDEYNKWVKRYKAPPYHMACSVWRGWRRCMFVLKGVVEGGKTD